jgi:hypothetical protein
LSKDKNGDTFAWVGRYMKHSWTYQADTFKTTRMCSFKRGVCLIQVNYDNIYPCIKENEGTQMCPDYLTNRRPTLNRMFICWQGFENIDEQTQAKIY